MPTIEGAKLIGGSPVTFAVPDGSPHVGSSTIWRDRVLVGSLELWMLGTTFVFTRSGGANGVYTLQSGSSSNAASIGDIGGSWANGTDFGLTAQFPPFPRGLPPTNGYLYALRISDTGQGVGFSDFLCASGSNDADHFSLVFSSQPSPLHTFTAKLYYQHV